MEEEGGEVGAALSEKDKSDQINVDTAGLLGEVAHPGRPKDEEPHIKRSVKKKQEVIDYLVRVDLEELGIDENNFEVGNQRG